jgi:hypothetical protein
MSAIAKLKVSKIQCSSPSMRGTNKIICFRWRDKVSENIKVLI